MDESAEAVGYTHMAHHVRLPVHPWVCIRVPLGLCMECCGRSAPSCPPTRTTQGPSWGYLKVNFSEKLSIFGDKFVVSHISCVSASPGGRFKCQVCLSESGFLNMSRPLVDFPASSVNCWSVNCFQFSNFWRQISQPD